MTYFYDWLSLGQWNMSPLSVSIFCLAAFIVGFAKTGLPGATIVAVPLMAMVVPPKMSVGIMLLLFVAADAISLYYWWRYAERRYCFPYLLFVGLGIWGASFVMGTVNDKTFGIIIGWLILSLVALSLFVEVLRSGGKMKANSPPPEGPSLPFSFFFGFSTGLISSLANAAGPIVSLYMILSRREKFQLLGTTAVCAFFMNWAKVFLFLSLGTINADTLKLDIAALPVLLCGAFAGFLLAKKIPQKAFKNVILALAFAASVNLILR